MKLPFYLSRIETSEINTGEKINANTEQKMARKMSAKIKNDDIIINRKVVTLSQTKETLDKSIDTNDFQLYLCENLKSWNDLDSYIADSNPLKIDLRKETEIQRSVFDDSVFFGNLPCTLSQNNINKPRLDRIINLRSRNNAIKCAKKT